MANNKVILSDGTTLIDLTEDTGDNDRIIAGTIIHRADGVKITGNNENIVDTEILSGEAAATAALIYSGRIAYINGNKLKGTMSNRGAVNIVLDNDTISYTVPKGYHNGNGVVTIDPSMYFTHTNSGEYKPGARKLVSTLDIDVGFQPKIFIMRASSVTAANDQTYDLIFGYCFKMPWDNEKYGCAFGYKTNRGGNSYGGQGPRISSTGVTGTGTSVYLVNGTYNWNAWG